MGGSGKRELHSDGTFQFISDMTLQFISANEKGPSRGGNPCVSSVSCRLLYHEVSAVRPRK